MGYVVLKMFVSWEVIFLAICMSLGLIWYLIHVLVFSNQINFYSLKDNIKTVTCSKSKQLINL